MTIEADAARAGTNELDRLTRLTDTQTVTIAGLERELREARRRLQDMHGAMRAVQQQLEDCQERRNVYSACVNQILLAEAEHKAALAETEADNARLREMLNRQWQPIETLPDRVPDKHMLLLAGGIRPQRIYTGMMPRAFAGWEKWWLLVPLPAPPSETDGG